MILGIEIVLLIVGLCALVTGKLTLGKNRVVHGPAARLLGLVAVIPIPLAFLGGLFAGAAMSGGGQNPLDSSSRWIFTAIEAVLVLVCLIVVFGVGSLIAAPPDSLPSSQEPANAVALAPEKSRIGLLTWVFLLVLLGSTLVYFVWMVK